MKKKRKKKNHKPNTERKKKDIKKHNKAVERKQKQKTKKEKIKHLNACANMEAIEEGKCAHGQIIEQMCDKGVQLNDIIFICLMLACSHACLVDGSMRCYVSMTTIYMIFAKLKHYTCMVDLLGRVDHLQEAKNMIKAMPMNHMWLHGRLCLALQNSG